MQAKSINYSCNTYYYNILYTTKFSLDKNFATFVLQKYLVE